MFETFDTADSVQVENFLTNSRNSIKTEAYKKTRQYGFDFLADKPLVGLTLRFVWTDETDRQLPLPRSTFAEQRLKEAQRRSDVEAHGPLTLSTHTEERLLTEDDYSTTCKILDFDSDSRRDFTRSSVSTLATMTDRMSSTLSEYGLEDDFQERYSDVDRDLCPIHKPQ
jgi:hypothetical protein